MGVHENLIQSFTNFKNKFIGNIGNSTVAALLNAKQNSTDNSLTTSSKTVVGAINELNSDLEDNIDNFMPQSTNNFLIQDGTTHNDVLLVSLTDPTREINRPHRVFQRSSTGVAIRNMPSDFPAGTGFVGIREVHMYDKNNLVVDLYPTQREGIHYYNRYNGSSWQGWIKKNYVSEYPTINTLNAASFNAISNVISPNYDGLGHFRIGEITSGCDLYQPLVNLNANSGDFTLHILHWDVNGFGVGFLVTPRLQTVLLINWWNKTEINIHKLI